MLNDGRAQFIITFKKSQKVNVTEIFIGGDDDTSGYDLGIDEAKSTSFTSSGKSYYSVYATEEIDITQLFGTIQIALRTGDSEKTRIGAITIGKWYENADLDEKEKTAWAELLYSMQALVNTKE